MTMRDGRPDHSEHAEAAVIGAALIDPNRAAELVTQVSPEDFYRAEHGLIWKAITWLVSKGTTPDVVTVINTCEKFGKLDAVGGRSAFSSLMDACPDVANATEYGKIVVELSSLRLLKFAVGQAQHADESDEALSIIQKAVDDVLSKRRLGEVQHLGDVATEAVKHAHGLADGTIQLEGITTGIECVDNVVQVLGSGQLIVLAGRPGMGKTAMACTIARNLALAGKSCLFTSLEMPATEVTGRILAGVAGVDSRLFSTGKGADMNFPNDWEVIEAALTRLRETRVIIDEGGAFTPNRVSALAKRIRSMEGGIDLVIVDYLQLMDPDSSFGNRDEQIGKITKALKRLSIELHIPVLLLAQLNRSPEKEERDPRLSDLRESGRIEQDADKVFFLAPTEHSPDGSYIKFIVAKNRQGEVKTEILRFDKRTSTMISSTVAEAVSKGARD